MSTVKEETSKRISSKKPRVRWAWKKQGDQYIVYSTEERHIIGTGSSLPAAKTAFARRFNQFLEHWGSEYKLEM